MLLALLLLNIDIFSAYMVIIRLLFFFKPLVFSVLPVSLLTFLLFTFSSSHFSDYVLHIATIPIPLTLTSVLLLVVTAVVITTLVHPQLLLPNSDPGPKILTSMVDFQRGTGVE